MNSLWSGVKDIFAVVSGTLEIQTRIFIEKIIRYVLADGVVKGTKAIKAIEVIEVIEAIR